MKRLLRPSILAAIALLWAAADCRAFFDPTIGRWASRDPIGENGGQNLYAIIYNAPLDGVDPLGLSSCKSEYKWVVHPPLLDRDLQSAQTITANTTIKIGPHPTLVRRQLSFSGLWGLTVTEPSLIGGDCCCLSQSAYKPFFQLNVHSQIYLLDKTSPAWGINRISTGDPDVDQYWYLFAQWYRPHLVMKHERKHQAHGKKNYEIWKAALQAIEKNSYSSGVECLQAVNQTLRQTWQEFISNEQSDVNALHGGGQTQ